MKRNTLWILTLLTSAALALPMAAQAQSGSATTAKHSTAAKKKSTAKKEAPAPAHKAKAKGKKGTASKSAKSTKTKAPPVEPPKEEQPTALEPPAAAGQVQTGTFPCELGEKVSVTADAADPGAFTVALGKRRYEMHQVESRTGAVRLEDERHGAVWLQLAVKSMLMDQKAGQRLADGCVSPEQKAYFVQLQHEAKHPLFAAPTGSSEQQNPGGAANAPAAGVTPPPFASVTGAPTGEPASAASPASGPSGGNRPPSGD